MGDDRDDRHVQLFRSRSRSSVEPLARRDVDHIHRQHGRQAEFQHLAHQVQVPLEVARVDDAQDHVDLRHVAAAGEQHVDRDHLVGRPRGQAVSARQIDDRELLPVERRPADLLLDRDAGVVARSLPEPRERAKQRRLAGVRIADQR
jgi:hypothetical protein